MIAARRHGEGSAILEVFTSGHGRHSGIVRGGGSRRMAPLLQPGTTLTLEWGARLEDHLGHFRVDVLRSISGAIIGDGAALAALASVSALLAATLPERDAHPALYRATRDLVAGLAADPAWPAAYVRWELALLGELGFGLDLATCAVTGAREDLAYVSPRTGRAVSRAGAGVWADRLLPLPEVLRAGVGAPGEVPAALALTGHFLDAWLAPTLARGVLPAARQRAVSAIVARETTTQAGASDRGTER